MHCVFTHVIFDNLEDANVKNMENTKNQEAAIKIQFLNFVVKKCFFPEMTPLICKLLSSTDTGKTLEHRYTLADAHTSICRQANLKKLL